MNRRLIGRKRKSRSGARSAARIFSGNAYAKNQGIYDGQLNMSSYKQINQSSNRKNLKSASHSKPRAVSQTLNDNKAGPANLVIDTSDN